MTILNDVRALVMRLSPNAICDDCIADKLGLPVRQHATHESRELAGESRFERRKAVCGLCDHEKLVIHFA